VTPKKLVFLGVLGLADCTPGREPHSVAASYYMYTLRLLTVSSNSTLRGEATQRRRKKLNARAQLQTFCIVQVRKKRVV